MKRALFALMALLGGTTVAVSLAEGWARLQPVPRIQQVFMLDEHVSEHNGVPIWRAELSDERENFGCVGEHRVLVLGSSILYGSGLSTPESLGPQLAPHLPGTCIHNIAQPGFTLQNQLAVAQRTLSGPLADRPPDVIVLEVWSNSINQLRVVGDQAYNFGELELDALGLPNPFSLPAALNARLFTGSAVYRYVNLTRSPRRHRAIATEEWRAFSAGSLQELIALAEAHEAQLLGVFMPELSQPFRDSAAAPFPFYAPAHRALEAAGAEVVYAASLMGDAPVEVHRLDPCCHYNAAGMARLAAALAPLLE